MPSQQTTITSTRINGKGRRRATTMLIISSFQPPFLSNAVTIVEGCEFSAAPNGRDPCEVATATPERQLNSSLRKCKMSPKKYRSNSVEQSVEVSKSPTKSFRGHSLSIGGCRSVPFLLMQFLLLVGLLRLAPMSAATSATANARSPLSVQHTAPLVAMTDGYDENDVILTPISSNLMRQLGERRGNSFMPLRERRSLANGRWGLRPGKRSALSSEYPSSAYPKNAKGQQPSAELLDAVVVAPAELMPKIYENLNAVVADTPSGAAASLAAAVSDEEWARKLATAHENVRFFLVRDN